MAETNRQWVLARRPHGMVQADDFEFVEGPIPEPAEGQALIRNVWLAFEPTQRTWLNASDTYMSSVAIGEVMRGAGVGYVVESRTEQLKPGDWVTGMSGWQDYVLAEGEGLFGFNRVPEGIPPRMMLGIFGSSGLTAYFGITEVGRVQPAETVYVSGAAGAVGSMALQIAKLRGATIIGSAGGPEKAEWVHTVLKADACIDYTAQDISKELQELAPNGLDVFFDNVGGVALEAALDNLAEHARIVLCGGISTGYDNDALPSGPRNYMQIGLRRARMEGFVFLDYVAQFPQAFGELAGWMARGDLTLREDIQHGLEHAPHTLRRLFEGKNLGKQLLEIAEPEVPSA